MYLESDLLSVSLFIKKNYLKKQGLEMLFLHAIFNLRIPVLEVCLWIKLKA